MKKPVFVLSAFVLLIIGGYLLYRAKTRVPLESLHLHNLNYPIHVGLYNLYRTEQADIVMLGNSLTEWVEWNELLGRQNIVNRGIAGDITSGYLHRLDLVYKLRPKICFIEGGINDLYAEVPVDVVFENYTQIVESLRANGIIPIIQSTLFVSPKWHDAKEKNKEVAELNARLHAYATQKQMQFVDLNKRMSENNLLRDEFTYDGVHLTAAGYSVWGEEVEKVLKQHSL
ncbi:MAG: GDSL family lipase [Ignavibacteriae bacterium]|nr:GDSL family lipase [Ignavibacteriota bacterium]